MSRCDSRTINTWNKYKTAASQHGERCFEATLSNFHETCYRCTHRVKRPPVCDAVANRINGLYSEIKILYALRMHHILTLKIPYARQAVSYPTCTGTVLELEIIRWVFEKIQLRLKHERLEWNVITRTVVSCNVKLTSAFTSLSLYVSAVICITRQLRIRCLQRGSK